eukprot:897279-Rhodomonas_salina.2
MSGTEIAYQVEFEQRDEAEDLFADIDFGTSLPRVLCARYENSGTDEASCLRSCALATRSPILM